MKSTEEAMRRFKRSCITCKRFLVVPLFLSLMGLCKALCDAPTVKKALASIKENNIVWRQEHEQKSN